MNLGIIILNYRTPDLVIGCLESLYVALDSCQVAVVDNASGDESPSKIRTAIDSPRWRSRVTLITAEQNNGYAAGNNIGIRYLAKTSPSIDYFLLLNPDTIVCSDALRELVHFMDTHPGTGVAGSRLENRDGCVECSAHNFPTPWSELVRSTCMGLIDQLFCRHVVSPPIRENAHACEWVSGAAMLVRRAVFDAIGLLDERYFLYFEEVDFCRRAHAAGWEIWYVPNSHIIHFEGESTGIREPHRRRPAYWYNSRRRFFLKSHGVVGLVLADTLWLIGRFLGIPRMILRRRRCPEPRLHTIDILWGDLLAIISGRAFRESREGING